MLNHIEPEFIRIWFQDKTKLLVKKKKFKRENLVNNLSLNGSKAQIDAASSSTACSPCLAPLTNTNNHPLSRKSGGNGTNQRHAILSATQSNFTVNSASVNQLLNRSKSSFKNTPSKASSISLSSPSAAILFNMNSNSFSFTHDNHLNSNAPSLQNSATKLQLASKVDFINGTSEVQSIKVKHDDNSLFKEDNMSTDFSNLTGLHHGLYEYSLTTDKSDHSFI